jgi:hypothetical protein
MKTLREKMTTGIDPSEQHAASPKTKTKAEPGHSVDKYAEARRAKKKEKRARHRAKLRRSNTGG